MICGTSQETQMEPCRQQLCPKRAFSLPIRQGYHNRAQRNRPSMLDIGVVILIELKKKYWIARTSKLIVPPRRDPPCTNFTIIAAITLLPNPLRRHKKKGTVETCSCDRSPTKSTMMLWDPGVRPELLQLRKILLFLKRGGWLWSTAG